MYNDDDQYIVGTTTQHVDLLNVSITRPYNTIDTNPELIISPKLYRLIPQLNLDELSLHFNVLKLNSLHHERVGVTLIDGEDYVQENVKLKPHFNQRLTIGTNINVTSYFFNNDIDMYRIQNNRPRYVLWEKDVPSPVCATYMDRTDVYNLFGALRRAIDWARAMPLANDRHESVVVFDLDRTLIDDNNDIMPGVSQSLQLARRNYDKIVLWSHGSSLHVDEHVCKLRDAIEEMNRDSCFENDLNFNLFDHVMSNNAIGTEEHAQSCKNLLHLYNYFPSMRFNRAVLVDDSLYNWTPEYTEMLVPISNDVSALRYTL
uniref:38K protein n=1 Tax=Nilaparvata lugens endogenous nudivirus TaxID=1487700 RepID=X5GY74_9VIRU|nr:38K protein [Nilaparvata lugens endogenous nudivirus]